MAYIKEYEVQVAGNSNGLVIPANHRIVVESSQLHWNGTEWCVQLIVKTYKDDSHSIKVDNDALPLDMCVDGVGATLPTDGTAVLVENAIEPILDTYYGSSNYITI